MLSTIDALTHSRAPSAALLATVSFEPTSTNLAVLGYWRSNDLRIYEMYFFHDDYEVLFNVQHLFFCDFHPSRFKSTSWKLNPVQRQRFFCIAFQICQQFGNIYTPVGKSDLNSATPVKTTADFMACSGKKSNSSLTALTCRRFWWIGFWNLNLALNRTWVQESCFGLAKIHPL
jgi:hypothetical protein